MFIAQKYLRLFPWLVALCSYANNLLYLGTLCRYVNDLFHFYFPQSNGVGEKCTPAFPLVFNELLRCIQLEISLCISGLGVRRHCCLITTTWLPYLLAVHCVQVCVWLGTNQRDSSRPQADSGGIYCTLLSFHSPIWHPMNVSSASSIVELPKYPGNHFKIHINFLFTVFNFFLFVYSHFVQRLKWRGQSSICWFTP